MRKTLFYLYNLIISRNNATLYHYAALLLLHVHMYA
jgi:hypothetical protein